MKFKNIYKITAFIALALVLQSKKNGPAGVEGLEVTGAPGSEGNAGTCGNMGCHVANAFSPTMSMEVLDGTNLVDKYEPGKTYTLKVTTTAGNGTPDVFGFQAVALDDNDAQIGDWGTLPTGFQKVPLSSRKYAEHSSPRTSNVMQIPWVAPAAGAGSVTFYSAGIAANGNDGTSGDGVAKNSITLTEGPLNQVNTAEGSLASIIVLPNPVSDLLTVQIVNRTAGNFKLRIINIEGAAVQEEMVYLNAGVTRSSFPVGQLPAGLYVLQLCGNGENMAAAQMLKH